LQIKFAGGSPFLSLPFRREEWIAMMMTTTMIASQVLTR
jgi:hypothetical protein